MEDPTPTADEARDSSTTWRTWCRFVLDIDAPNDAAARSQVAAQWDDLRAALTAITNAYEALVAEPLNPGPWPVGPTVAQHRRDAAALIADARAALDPPRTQA